MRLLVTRRTALSFTALGVAAALTGCSAGQVAETARKNASVYGVEAANADRSVLVRGLSVVYNGPAGYPAGGTAPLEVNLFNETTEPVTVLVSSQPPTGAAADETSQVVSGTAVGLLGGAPTSASSAIPEPSGSRPAASPMTETSPRGSVPSPDPSTNPSPGETPSAAPVPSGATPQPARITIGPLSYVAFQPDDAQKLVVTGLTDQLRPGMSVNLVFEFSNGAAPLVVQAPTGIPYSPASRAPGLPAEHHGESE